MKRCWGKTIKHLVSPPKAEVTPFFPVFLREICFHLNQKHGGIFWCIFCAFNHWRSVRDEYSAGELGTLGVACPASRVCSRTLGAILGFSSAGRKGALSTWGCRVPPCWNLTLLGRSAPFSELSGVAPGVCWLCWGTRHGVKGGTGGTGTSEAPEWLECHRNVTGMSPECHRAAPGIRGHSPICTVPINCTSPS